MKKNHNIIEVAVTLVHETEKAYLIAADDTGIETWIPKSRCELDCTKTELQIDEDFALEKGLI